MFSIHSKTGTCCQEDGNGIDQSVFEKVSDKRSVTPDSRNKLPNINIPNKEVMDGNNKEMKIVEMIGNAILSKRELHEAVP